MKPFADRTGSVLDSEYPRDQLLAGVEGTRPNSMTMYSADESSPDQCGAAALILAARGDVAGACLRTRSPRRPPEFANETATVGGVDLLRCTSYVLLGIGSLIVSD